jgi:hypothetical protein
MAVGGRHCPSPQICPALISRYWIQLTKGAAREALRKEIATQTGQNLGGKIMKDGSVTFGWFVRNRYYPLRDWRPETEKVKKIQIERIWSRSLTVFRWRALSSSPYKNISSISLHFSQRTG